jgi:O-antigen/teichoic acid export membrane protein
MCADAEARTPTTRTPLRAATFRLLRMRVARRLGWGVADQALSSLTNLVVTLSVAQTLGAVQFGAFTLAYVTYGFALTASKALASDPLLVRFGGADAATWRRAIAGCSGTAAAVGMASSACVLGISALTDGTTRDAFLALGLVLPVLLIQDSWRYAFFAIRRGGQAFLNDTVWALTLVPAVIFLRVSGHANVFWFVLAWGAAAGVAAIVGVLQTRVLPNLWNSRLWLAQHRDLGLRYLAEGASASAAGQLRTIGIGIILGLAAVGYVQAAFTLLGPVMILMYGAGAVMVPEIVQVFRRSPRDVPKVCFAYGTAIAAAALVWGGVLLIALPRGLGGLLLGEVWEPAYPLIPLIALAFMGGSLQAGAGAGLRALGAARRSLRAMIVSSIAVVVCPLLGALLGGTSGVALGAAAAAWFGALVWWRHLGAALREAAGKPVAQGEPASQSANIEVGLSKTEGDPDVLSTRSEGSADITDEPHSSR